MTNNTVVRARIVAAALATIGPTVSDALRLMMTSIARRPMGGNVSEAGTRQSVALEAKTKLEEIIQSDAEQLWANIQTSLEDEQLLDKVKGEFETFLARHGRSSLRSLGGFMLNRLPGGDASWTILRMLGESRDTKTMDARRDVLLAVLESRDAGLRYAAASALSELSDSRVTDSLRNRLTWEKNPSVQHMIEAALRK